MGGAEGVGSTWCIVPVRLLFKADSAHLSMSDARSYPVTRLAAFALSGAVDNWDAINAQNLGSLPRQAPIPKHAGMKTLETAG